jgi:hypothetical protein
MPNIVLVGYDARIAEDLIREVKRVVGDTGLADDSVITFVNSTVDKCSENAKEPYAIVRCNNQDHLDLVSKALNLDLGIGVETELIQQFLPPLPDSKWNLER